MRAWIPVMIAVGAFNAAVDAQTTDLTEITIASPAVTTVGRDMYGSRIRELSGTVQVHYNPLMLTTNSGRALLDARVAEVARRVCSANGIYSNVDDNWHCVGQAIKAAESKLDAATAQVRIRLAQGQPIPAG